MIAAPAINSGLGPHRRSSRPATGDITSIAKPAGIRNRLACSSGMPSPPAALGSSSSCGKAICDENSANPIAIEARLVKSTGPRALTRRSTSGSRRRNSSQPHANSTTVPPTRKPSVRVDVHPQSLPREIASRTPDKPTARPAMPALSTRPPTRSALSGTKLAIKANAVAPRPAATQNSTCQSKCSLTRALTGSPSAPPTPSVALTKAMAEPRRSAGRVSRRMAMPNGMTPIPTPCRPRPMISGSTVGDNAATAEPSINTASRISATRRLPYMSPNLPEIGVQIAATSNVMVMTHAVFEADVFSSCGSSPWMGMRMVWVNAAHMPAKASTDTTAPVCTRRSDGPADRSSAVRVSTVINHPSSVLAHRTGP